MHTLLLRLAGPMQSWGTQSRFTIRDTGLEPSKSGVVGLLCAALGKPRDETHPNNRDQPKLEALAALRMGVRISCEGVPQKDYHTAGGSRHDNYGVVKANGAKPEPVVSHRYYLADADFLVGLESDDAELLRRLDESLGNPRWQLFLGRKSFVPGLPVRMKDGLKLNTALEDALCTEYLWPANRNGKPEPRLRCVIEPRGDDPEAAEVRHDVPLSFAERRFTIRYVKTTWIDFPQGDSDAGDAQTVFVEADSQFSQ
jgi:CRISPR system Cascade subunit CasD